MCKKSCRGLQGQLIREPPVQIWIPKESLNSSDPQAVEDLANRSLSVSELVDFYGQLGTGRAMPLPAGKDQKILGLGR